MTEDKMNHVFTPTQVEHQQLVSMTFKNIDGRGGKMELLHAILGIAGEVGELVDAVKKHVFYEQPLNHPNVHEELGDIEYYLEAFRQNLSGGTYYSQYRRDTILQGNLDKLRKRYPENKFSLKAADERLDKVSSFDSDLAKQWHDPVRLARPIMPIMPLHEPGSVEWYEFQETRMAERSNKDGVNL